MHDFLLVIALIFFAVEMMAIILYFKTNKDAYYWVVMTAAALCLLTSLIGSFVGSTEYLEADKDELPIEMKED